MSNRIGTERKHPSIFWSTAGVILDIAKEAYRRYLSETQGAVSKALDSPEGRVALSMAMVEPIKVSLEYQSIGRKLLMVDELPPLQTIPKQTP